MDISPEKLLDTLRSGAATKELKQSLARGLIPLSPRKIVETLVLLADDSDRAIGREAESNLKKLPVSIIRGVCSAPEIGEALLDALARTFSENEMILEDLLLNQAISDQTVAHIATLSFPALLEIIGRNYLRLERDQQIMENLRENSETPQEIIHLWKEHLDRRQLLREDSSPSPDEELKTEGTATDNLPAVLFEEEEQVTTPEIPAQQEAVEKKQLSVIQLLKKMSMGQKVALAVKGNREVRNILIREKNRLLSMKVLESPRITDSDIEAYAKSTNLSEEILRAIGHKKEWCRKYSVVRGLVFNPKAPLGTTLRLLKRLNFRDTERVSKNRNVPDTLRSAARRIVSLKQKSRG